jgi:hypothetical protein
MKLRIAAACACALWLPSLSPAAPMKAKVRRAPAAVSAAASVDEGLADFSLQPFTDLGSHGVLWRRGKGLLAWRLCSARAFGSQAAGPNGAKCLADISLDLDVEGGAPAFVSVTPEIQDGPLWAGEKAAVDGLSVEDGLVFDQRDLVVGAVNLRNLSGKVLRLRPRFHLRRDGDGFKGSAELSGRYPAVWLTLDRSQAVGRRLVEYAGVWVGGSPAFATLSGETLTPRIAKDFGANGMDLTLTWVKALALAPGQSLRIPILWVWGNDLDVIQKAAVERWVVSAQPKGRALGLARRRWSDAVHRIPECPGRERLTHRALLDLLNADYGREASLAADAFSAQKGIKDAFFSVDSPLAACAWAEWDWDAAEAAVLDQESFSAAAPAAVPPFTGEEKLPWDAAGLPLNGWAAWELYHRDPDPQRATRFFTAFGTRLRNECAWWPPNRDGDGNGLYAYARDEEKPEAAGPAPANPGLEQWSLSLTSVVSWQFQVGAALAQAAGDSAEAERLMALARHSQEALRAQAWDVTRSAYVQGLDGFWPLELGLETDPARAAQQMRVGLLDPLRVHQDPWTENGEFHPWKVYMVSRALAANGALSESAEVANDFLDRMAALKAFPAVLKTPNGALEGGSAATASAILELALGREQQEMFLTTETGEFKARWLQFRSLDGNFYMKRVRLPKKNAKYAEISVETLKHGKILAEGAFVVSATEPMAFQIQSEQPLSISPAEHPERPIFKQAHKVEWLLPASKKFLIRFNQETKQN